jgi:hypothetical protein
MLFQTKIDLIPATPHYGGAMLAQAPPSAHALKITWDKLPNDFVLPDDPVENIQQP